VSTQQTHRPLETPTLLRPGTLAYLYRRRLRVHVVQELLAGIGVAIAVALVFAALVANASIAGSAGEVVRVVAGPANLQLHARGSAGLDERLLARVERIPGVLQAAPMLERSASIVGPSGQRVGVNLAGASIGLGRLNGLARTLPAAAFTPGAVSLSKASAEKLGVTSANAGNAEVTLDLSGTAHRLKVAAVLGGEAAGALANASVAIMALAQMQKLIGMPARVSRILVQTRHGHEGSVRAALERLAGERLTVATISSEVALLREALHPSDQASTFFAAISALLGFLFAFNAMLLTVPERRQAIADMRLNGTRRAAIVQIFGFQALCLGTAASLLGLLVGYALSLGVFRQSSGYLSEAFTIGTNTVVDLQPVALAIASGLIATALASAVPLLDLRRGRTLDAVYFEDTHVAPTHRVRLGATVVGLVAIASVTFHERASLGFIASGILALATVLAVPLVFDGVLFIGAAAARLPRLPSLQLALTSLKAATIRSLALAATGAVAIFGSIALGGSRDDLLRGIDTFAHSYASAAELWVSNPNDNQGTVPFAARDYVQRISRVPGVQSVAAFQGSFLDVAARRAWVIALPPGADAALLRGQIVEGDARLAGRRLARGGWIVASKQIAEQQHAGPGGTLTLATPAGNARFALAASATNLAWSPGAILMSSGDYRRLWHTDEPTTLGVQLMADADEQRTQRAVAAVLAGSGLEVSSAQARYGQIVELAEEGLRRLGEISTMLVFAAILAMAAALGSSTWQRRAWLAGLRLTGVRPARLRRVLLIEALLMLSAGALAGVAAGVYGELIIDNYLRHVTGFPVASVGASWRPLEILALVVVLALSIVAVPVWAASRVSPTLALDD
jgi:putative ABC transport system permease protein